MRKRIGIIGLGVGVLLVSCGEARADHPLFEQKSRLLDRFLVQSATSEQVGRGEDAKLKEILDQTRKLREEARQLHDQGDIDQATKRVDLAIKEAVKLSQLTSGPAKQAWNQQIRFEGLMAGVATFEDAYQRNLQVLAKESGKALDPSIQSEEIRQVVAKASELAGKGSFDPANALLADMQQRLTTALKAMLDSKTLVYQLKFETPQHEYRYELDRMLSFEALLNMALSRAALDEKGRRTIQERQEKSRVLHREAEQLAAAGKYTEAIRTMESANDNLSQAMMMAGIVFP
ncbi:MAG: hypothetical protein HQM00_05335 [Magnetococcales bacterium]|nr:hypothetical protein [Magnetococcales bacterium]